MLNLRPAVARVAEPLAASLLRLGVTPDAVTIAGTVCAVAGALSLFSTGHFALGTLLVTLSVLTDAVDGTMARQLATRNGPSGPFGAFLDSTMDRLADGAIFLGIALWYAGPGQSRLLVGVAVAALILGAVTSYAKARAQSVGLSCDVGLLERAERLIIVLVGTGLTGVFGLTAALPVALWLLAIGSGVTVVQRLVEVHRQAVQAA